MEENVSDGDMLKTSSPPWDGLDMKNMIGVRFTKGNIRNNVFLRNQVDILKFDNNCWQMCVRSIQGMLLTERNQDNYVLGRCPLLDSFVFVAADMMGMRNGFRSQVETYQEFKDAVLLMKVKQWKKILFILAENSEGFDSIGCWLCYSMLSQKRLSKGHNALKLAVWPSPLLRKICFEMAVLIKNFCNPCFLTIEFECGVGRRLLASLLLNELVTKLITQVDVLDAEDVVRRDGIDVRTDMKENTKRNGGNLRKSQFSIIIVKRKIVYRNGKIFKSHKEVLTNFRGHKTDRKKVEYDDSQRKNANLLAISEKYLPNEKVHRSFEETKWIFKDVILFFTPQGKGCNEESKLMSKV
jgi:hypothetical protein